MSVRVRLFAACREAVGRRELVLELPDDATLGQLRDVLLARQPELAALADSARFVVNQEYADPALRLRPGDDVVVLPPVSGG